LSPVHCKHRNIERTGDKRFHIVAKVNKALDEIRAAEARRVKSERRKPLLHKSRCCYSNAKTISRTSSASGFAI
jgi:hypothetical protein